MHTAVTAVTEDETLINATQVQAMMGGVSEMWLHRKLKLADPAQRFPEPDAVIANRRYWKLGRVRAWRDAQAGRKTRGPAAAAAGAAALMLMLHLAPPARQNSPSWTSPVTLACDPGLATKRQVAEISGFHQVRAPACVTGAASSGALAA